MRGCAAARGVVPVATPAVLFDGRFDYKQASRPICVSLGRHLATSHSYCRTESAHRIVAGCASALLIHHALC